MVIIRDVFKVKYGKGDEFVELFKEFRTFVADDFPVRILTDLSGQFFTVISEYEYDSLADYERKRTKLFARPEFGEWFEKMTPLVKTGNRQFLNLVK